MLCRRIPWLVVCLALVAAPAAGQSVAPTEIVGRIELSGCSPNPTEIHLKALPASGVPVGNSGSTPANMGVGVARISSKDSSGGYPFVIPSLDARKAYRISVSLQDKSCGKLRWQGPSLVLPGDGNVRIGGLAVRTQIEILADPDQRGARQWVGAKIVNLLDPVQAQSKIRLYTDNAAVESFLLQFSDRPFPTIPRAIQAGCQSETSQNLLGSKRVGASGPGWTEATVNFNDALFPPLGIQQTAQYGTAASAGIAGTSAMATELAMGAPVYVRVIPEADDREPLCDPSVSGVGGWIIVSTGGLFNRAAAGLGGASTVHVAAADYQKPKVFDYPKSGESCYRAVQFHTIGQVDEQPMAIDFAFDQFIINGTAYRNGHVFAPNDTFCIPGADGADEVVGTAITLVSGTLDAIGFMVTSIAKLWDQIKGAVAAVLVNVINAVGIECEGACAAAIEMGINAGLAAMGLPPSLPNWEELQQQGLDYLAAQIANQAGLPPEAVELAMDYAVAAMEELGKTRGGDGQGLPRWVQADIGFEPAVLTFELRQEGSAGVFEPQRTLTVLDNPALLGGTAPLPALGQAPLQLPMVLRPNLADLPPRPFSDGQIAPGADAMWYKTMWLQRVKDNPCVGFQVQLAEKLIVGEPTVGSFLLASRLFVSNFYVGPLLPGYTYDSCAR